MNSQYRKQTILAALLIICLAGAAQATPITYTMVLAPDTMSANPFGLSDKPAELYAYFTFDDKALATNGGYRDMLTDFELDIGNTSWALSDIQVSYFRVQDYNVTELNLYIPSSAGNNNLGMSSQGVSNDFEWNAYDGYQRNPSPILIGRYSIVSGIVGGGSLSVPEPGSLALFFLGLLAMRKLSIVTAI